MSVIDNHTHHIFHKLTHDDVDFFDDTPEEGPVNRWDSLLGEGEDVAPKTLHQLGRDGELLDEFPEDALGEPGSELWY